MYNINNLKSKITIIVSKDDSFLKLLRANLKKYYGSRKRKPEDKIHVSDIFFGSCLRKAYYVHIFDEYEFTDNDIDNLVRGESSEHILVGIADIGVNQQELFLEDDLIARPGLMSGTAPNADSPNDKNLPKRNLPKQL